MGTNDGRPDGSDGAPVSVAEPPASGSPAEPARPRKARRVAARASDFRVAEQPGFVLHSHPYRETSLII
ncbi:DNA recombination protein RecO, partial [Burkholderia glumae]